jgi:CRP-like cAMP-binding protein
MVVLEGSAAVTRGSHKLGVLSVGQVFGEMALLDDQPRSATVKALEPMRMLVIPGPAFRRLLTTVPGLSDALLATLSMRLREANAAAEPG